jgi:hypothetical protein
MPNNSSCCCQPMKPPKREETWTAAASLDDLREGDLAEVSAGADLILQAYLPGGEVRAYQGSARTPSTRSRTVTSAGTYLPAPGTCGSSTYAPARALTRPAASSTSSPPTAIEKDNPGVELFIDDNAGHVRIRAPRYLRSPGPASPRRSGGLPRCRNSSRRSRASRAACATTATTSSSGTRPGRTDDHARTVPQAADLVHRRRRTPAAQRVQDRHRAENGDIGQPLTVSLVAAGGAARLRIPQANVYATDAAAGATVLSISTGHILATLVRAVGEFRQVSAVVASINKQTTVIETDQTMPVTAPDQVVIAGRLESGVVASIAVQGGSAPVTPGFEFRIVGTEATLVIRPAAPGGITSPTGPSP